jgi:hypothetical protein
MGTPSSTPVANSPTKKMARFQLPIDFRNGVAICRATTTKAMAMAASSTGRQPWRARRSRQVSSMSAKPAGMAAARTMLDRPRAGVSINHSSAA